MTKKQPLKYSLRHAALCGVAAFALIGAVHAQDNPTDDTSSVDEQIDDTADVDSLTDNVDENVDGDLRLDQVRVTGSRLRNSFTSDAPLQFLDVQDGLDLGLESTAELIRNSSLLSGAPQDDATQSVIAIGGFSGLGGNGVNTLSLRGLGSQRTLVLLDGRRLSPSGIQGAVSAPNISVIPSSILSGVEILKDGASSVYGSDAIAGVVNNLTIKESNTSSVSAFTRISEAGGGESFQVNGRFSRSYDKGYFNVAAQYDRRERLELGDRDTTDCRDPRLTDPDTGEIVDNRDPVTGEVVCRGFGTNNRFFIFRFDNVNAGPFNDVNSLNNRFAGFFIPDPDGTIIGPGQGELRGILPEFARVGVFRLGVTNPAVNFGPNSGSFELSSLSNAILPQTSPFIQNGNAINPEERYSVFLNGAYDLSNNLEAYGQFLFNRTETDVRSFRFLFANLGAGLPSNTVAERLNTATGGALSGRVGFNIIRPFFSENETNYYNSVVGLRGNFGDAPGFLNDWQWDVFFQYGRSDAEYTSNFTRQDRLDAVTGSTQTVACNPGELNPEVSPDPSICDGINIPFLSPRILRDGIFTPEEEAFLEGVETGTTTYDQIVLEGFADGTLFNLPAGPVSAGVGFHLQNDEINDTPGPNAIGNNNHNFSNSLPTIGDASLFEGFFEVGVPLLKDQLLAKRVAFTGSGRLTKHSEFSDPEFTYKAGLAWDPIEFVRFRTTYGTSYRAPALFELFQGGRTTFGPNDPCVNLQNSNRPAEEVANLINNCGLLGIGLDLETTTNIQVRNAGNNSGTLRPETSKAFNAGIVLTPVLFDKVEFSLAVDYFDIEINDQIDRLGGQTIIDRCLVDQSLANLAAFDSDMFCALLDQRNALNELEGVLNAPINIARQTSRGLDIVARAEFEINGIDFSTRGQLTHQLEDFFDEDADTSTVETEINQLGLGLRPKTTGTLNFSARKGNFSAFWGITLIGASDQRRRLNELPNNGFNEGELARQRFDEPFRFLGPLIDDTRVEFYHRHTVSGTYNFDDTGWRLQAGVRNVFDEDPPLVGFGVQRTGNAARGFDTLGRSFFARVTKRF